MAAQVNGHVTIKQTWHNVSVDSKHEEKKRETSGDKERHRMVRREEGDTGR